MFCDPLLQEDYRDYENNEPYHQLLELVIASLDEASRKGVPLSSGERLHPIQIGNKGDWPYLVACTQRCIYTFLKLTRVLFVVVPKFMGCGLMLFCGDVLM